MGASESTPNKTSTPQLQPNTSEEPHSANTSSGTPTRSNVDVDTVAISSLDIDAPDYLADPLRNLIENVLALQIKEINVLLYGDDSAERSSFINSLSGYLKYESFNAAVPGKMNAPIPTIFKILENDGDLEMIKVGDAEDVGGSTVQILRTYNFLIMDGKCKMQIIDMSELKDANCKDVLAYMSNIGQLHAICYLCKPRQDITSYFQRCISQITTLLHIDACDNLIFIFTDNSYDIEAFQSLKKLTDYNQINRNTFFFNKEPLVFLKAIKENDKMEMELATYAAKNWKIATEECWRMMDYITKLKPYQICRNSVINETRSLIYQLLKPMADICQLVQDNILVLQYHEHEMKLESRNTQKLRQLFYVPSIELEVTKLKKPAVICADSKCCKLYKIEGRNEFYYNTRCHHPCNLHNVQREVIGAPELINCDIMNLDGSCKNCGCSYKVHMLMGYLTKKTSGCKPDITILNSIKTEEDATREANKFIKNIELKKRQFDYELSIIMKSNARFLHFLKTHSIVAFTDAYAKYLQFLISRETSLGKDCDHKKLSGLEALLKEHIGYMSWCKVDGILGPQSSITQRRILQTMSQLCNLPLSGRYTKKLCDSQGIYLECKLGITEDTPVLTSNKEQKTNQKKDQSYHRPNRNERSGKRQRIRSKSFSTSAEPEILSSYYYPS
ncbi:hypothetical protein GWI33_017319 [Rhynchophorus ferrugineus]|uniref:DUF8206 domain-containing protein n=1 Tax=Rhynchophorus ferrugineus TaxID=354439 RepID=A0A834I9G8_RHYFE|nr:hypothetical protein GWI33_017319 [Rhynchophorus ferrugineus]